MKQKEAQTIQRRTQYFSYISTDYVYYSFIFALLPALLWGFFVFGPQSLLVFAVSLGTALLVEFLISRISSHPPMYIHAFWIGILIAAFMPPAVSFFVPCFAVLFALVVVKCSFGSITNCWMNPAAAGIVFVSLSFPERLSKGWLEPDFNFFVANRLVALSERLPVSEFDTWLSTMSNQFLGGFDIVLSPGKFDPLFGNVAGSIAGVSILLILAGSLIILARRVIPWQLPLISCFSFATSIYVLTGEQLFSGNVLHYVSSGNFILGIFFLAPDITSFPTRRLLQCVYALLLGQFAFLFRDVNGGFAMAVLLANVLCQPLLNDRVSLDDYNNAIL